MLDDRTAARLRQGLRVAQIIWAMMLAALAVYVAFPRLMAGQTTDALSGPPADPMQRYAFMALGMILLLALPIIRRKIIGAPPGRSSGKSPDAGPLLARYLRGVVISLALAEAVAVLGLVLYLRGETAQVLYIFTAASAAAMFAYRPRWAELEELARGPN